MRRFALMAWLVLAWLACGLLDGTALADARAGAGDGPGGTGVMGSVCEPGWLGGLFADSELDGSISALVVFDDGTGAALYAGGSFTTAGGAVVNGIARWDGSEWSALAGPGGVGVSGSVFALSVFDDGAGAALYAGGDFVSAGGTTVNHIARWDGRGWSGLGASGVVGVSGAVSALTAFDDGGGAALYVGGRFAAAGGVAANNIARWDGTGWSSLGGPGGAGVSGGAFPSVFGLTVFDDGGGSVLYVGGSFGSAGGMTANGIARWDGSAWSAVAGPGGVGVSGGFAAVFALAVFGDDGGPALYVGGSFVSAGGVAANNIARWDGSAWSALAGPGGVGVGGGSFPSVVALASFDDGTGAALYAGGDFVSAGGVTANNIARWDGAGWSALGSSGLVGVNAFVEELVVVSDGGAAVLYAGGNFTVAGGGAMSRIAGWDGSAWSALGRSVNGSVGALSAFGDGGGVALYAGGLFNSAGGQPARGIARWDGASWSPVGGGVDGSISPFQLASVLALAAFDDGSGPALYAGGNFTTAGGLPANFVARWDGVSWSALGTGVNGIVTALLVFDDGRGPALYAGGAFGIAGGVPAVGIARWDGSAWSALEGPGGVGLNGPAHALAVFDDGLGAALYAGGEFVTADGATVNRIARWDGSEWSALEGLSGVGVGGVAVRSLAVFDDGAGAALYAGGDFPTAGGVLVNRIARWDGAEWSALAGPGGVGVSGGFTQVAALRAFDDGSGAALYAGGEFSAAGGVAANRIARWDGSGWSALDTGLSGGGIVLALGVFDDGSGSSLFVGGSFDAVGAEVSSANVAKWQGCAIEPGPCPGDLTNDGGIDSDDLGVLLGAFGSSGAGDLNGDGVTDSDDLGILLGVFGSACE